MIFDPFGDFKERGYLRNNAALHDAAAVKEYEHRAFLGSLDTALARLAGVAWLSYQDILDTHRTLFGAVYPWAGQDRAQTAPTLAISRGSVLFAHPEDARKAVDHALRMGQDKELMARKPGEVMGYLAYGHPFLDGNGRAIMVVHTELAERAGISVDWSRTDKASYLAALTRELEHPGKGHLDAYLKPFVESAIGRERLALHVARAKGIDGSSRELESAHEVAGAFSDPALQARYRHQQEQRGEAERLPVSLARAAAATRDERGEENSGRKPPPDRGGSGRGGRGR